MDQFAQPSFIPKKTFAPVVPPRKRSVGLFFVISALLFLASLLGYAGAFAYSKTIDASMGDLRNTLAQKREKFDTQTLEDLTKTDARLLASRTLLERHRTLAPLFEILDAYTLQTVRFRTFEFKAGRDGEASIIKLTGDAAGYSSIALQSDSFSSSGKIANILFSNLNLGEAGRVVFTLTAAIDPSLLSYKSYVASLGAQTSSVPAQSTSILAPTGEVRAATTTAQ